MDAQSWAGRFTQAVMPGQTGEFFMLRFLAAVAVTLLPLFHLTVKNWTNGWLAFLAAVSFVGLVLTVKNKRDLFPGRLSIAIVVALALPLVAVVVSQLFRGSWVWNYLDGPSRFLLAAVAFLWLRPQEVDFVRVFRVVCPLSIWFALFFVWLDPEPTQFWLGRFATSIADTNTFGTHIVLMGFFSFLMLQLAPPKSWALKILLATSVGVSAYLSIGSQTRTGWIALPLLGLVWIYAMRREIRKATVTSAVMLAFVGAVAVSYPTVQDRAKSIYTELVDYVTGSNPDTSGGARIGIWRIALELFKQRPFQGYGDYAQFKDYLGLPEVKSVANDFAVDTIRNGPHNETLANALRSGVFGVVAVLGLYLVPFFVFCRGQASTNGFTFVANNLGLATVVAFVVFGTMLETFNLKFCASLYGFLIAVFAAQGMSKDETVRGRQP